MISDKVYLGEMGVLYYYDYLWNTFSESIIYILLEFHNPYYCNNIFFFPNLFQFLYDLKIHTNRKLVLYKKVLPKIYSTRFCICSIILVIHIIIIVLDV